MLNDLDFARENSIGDVVVSLVREEGDAGYVPKLVLIEGYNLVRSSNPEDDVLMLLVDADLPGIRELFSGRKRPTHVMIGTKVYSIDFGDMPLSTDEDIMTLRLGGTGEQVSG